MSYTATVTKAGKEDVCVEFVGEEVGCQSAYTKNIKEISEKCGSAAMFAHAIAMTYLYSLELPVSIEMRKKETTCTTYTAEDKSGNKVVTIKITHKTKAGKEDSSFFRNPSTHLSLVLVDLELDQKKSKKFSEASKKLLKDYSNVSQGTTFFECDNEWPLNFLARTRDCLLDVEVTFY